MINFSNNQYGFVKSKLNQTILITTYDSINNRVEQRTLDVTYLYFATAFWNLLHIIIFKAS